MTIEENIPLRDYTTFHVGGKADFFATAHTVEELVELFRWAKDKKIKTTIISGGSNVLIPDGGIRGLVIKVAIDGVEYKKVKSGVEVIAGAGVAFDTLVEETVNKNLWGLENLSGIPGSVGATPIQNVGAYGVEVADCVQWVEVLDCDTYETKMMSAEVCEFRYRDSVFKIEKGRRFVILRVSFGLSETPNPILTYRDLDNMYKGATEAPTGRDIRETVLEIRSKKFPDWNTTGTAGSFFKNPIISEEHADKLLEEYPDLPHFEMPDGRMKISLGWILDNVCHMRGYREGDVGTYGGQALVLLNYGHATAKEISDFAKKISTEVKKKTNIDVEWEVTKLS